MGAWGTGVFENDGAGDLLAALRSAEADKRAAVLREALEFVADCDDYLENPDAQGAVAAAAVVAAARNGQPLDSLNPDTAAAAGAVGAPGDDLVELARRALDQVVGEQSEWRELWAEAGKLDEALAAVAPVRAGLG